MTGGHRVIGNAIEVRAMDYPFPGMDPYLEHPVLWEGVHARLIVAIANQLQPLIDPRYVTSIEERVYIEGPQRRIPDVWIQRVGEQGETAPFVEPKQGSESDTALIVEVENLEIHEARIEILDAYNEMKLVALIEVVSPANKAAGPGRASYMAKQEQTLAPDCHLIEIDLIRRGRHVVCIPQWRVRELKMKPFDYLCCVNRWPTRNRFELYARRLGEPSTAESAARGGRPRHDARSPSRARTGLRGRAILPPHPIRPEVQAALDAAESGMGRSADVRVPRAHPDFFTRKDVP